MPCAQANRTDQQETTQFNQYSVFGSPTSRQRPTTMGKPGDESAVRTSQISRTPMGRAFLMRRRRGVSAVRTNQSSTTLLGRATPMRRRRVREFASTQSPDLRMTQRRRTSRVLNPKDPRLSAIVPETKTSLSPTPIMDAAGTDPTIPVRRTTSGKGSQNERSRRHHLRNHRRLARNIARRNRNGEKSGAKSAEKASS
jgi:hypothetical protein